MNLAISNRVIYWFNCHDECHPVKGLKKPTKKQCLKKLRWDSCVLILPVFLLIAYWTQATSQRSTWISFRFHRLWSGGVRSVTWLWLVLFFEEIRKKVLYFGCFSVSKFKGEVISPRFLLFFQVITMVFGAGIAFWRRGCIYIALRANCQNWAENQ